MNAVMLKVMDERLRNAVRGGNPTRMWVQEMIAGGANIEAKDEAGATPLFLAVVYGHVRLFDLLSTPAMLRQPLFDGACRHYTHLAVSTGSSASLRELLRLGCSPNVQLHGYSLLAYALSMECHKMARIIMADGRWRVVAENSDEHPMDYVLFNTYNRVTYLSRWWWTRWDIACDLFDRGVNVNILRDGWSPLCYAIRGQYHHQVQMLLERGSDVNLVLPNGLYPLAMAVITGNFCAVVMLLERYPNMCLTSRLVPRVGCGLAVSSAMYGQTPLVCAMILNDVMMVRQLVEAGCSLRRAAAYISDGPGLAFRQRCQDGGNEDLIDQIESATVAPHRLTCLARDVVRAKLGRDRVKMETLSLPRPVIDYLVE